MAMPGESEYAPKRMDAIKLAKASKWEELRRLVDAEALTAQQVDSYGMLPLHWACTEPHAISETVLMSLLKAFPHGARAVNTAGMLPLQIAIKAQAKIEWLQALLASYPDAVLKKAPTGEHAVQLARKASLPARSVKLLEEMFHHVCEKAGYSSEQLGYDDEQLDDRMAPPPPLQTQSLARGSSGYALNPRPRDSAKARTLSDNEFQLANVDALRSTAGSSESFRSTAGSTAGSMGGGSGLQYQPNSRVSGSGRSVVTLPPRWTMAPNCHICSQKFRPVTKKRHHCRNCGQAICSDHSARERVKLPHYGLNDRHRVCTVCHDVLRNAGRQLQPLSQPRFVQAHTAPARKSDEALQRPPEGLSQALERHVSAPARATMEAPHPGIHDQVASLQKQVSQLLEEKELAESQLRAQAELLGDALDPDRRSQRDSRGRFNSYSLKFGSSAGASTSETPPLLSGGFGQMYGSYEGRGLARTSSSGSFSRGREVDIDRPSEDPSHHEPVRAPPAHLHVAALQDEFANLAVAADSAYDAHSTAARATEGFGDLHDTDDDDDADSEPPQPDDYAGVDDDEGDFGTLPEIDVFLNLGLSMMERGLASAAVQAFTRAVEIAPNDATLHSYLGRALYADENLDDAVVALTRSLELEPSATNSTLLGKILFEKGDHEKAIEAYQKSLEYQQSHA
ncbi:hypothetical protein PybrP1_011542 [[Pythium] brassicae (nom. inval.)]|nr:hypothetical protein PybrP1_011542 [[Pythium] brassicae (nom. inval.)]